MLSEKKAYFFRPYDVIGISEPGEIAHKKRPLCGRWGQRVKRLEPLYLLVWEPLQQKLTPQSQRRERWRALPGTRAGRAICDTSKTVASARGGASGKLVVALSRPVRNLSGLFECRPYPDSMTG